MNTNFSQNTISKTNITEEIKPFLRKQSSLYIVGGYIRDKFFSKENFDIDFIVKGENAINLAKNFAQQTGRYFILLDEKHEIARVVDKDKTHYFDFARCENDNIQRDLQRRDLTINSIAMQIFPKVKILDNFNGISDLENKIIKIISEKNLTDDPLRILRIFRFASILNFEIDEETEKLAQKHCQLIKNVAPERILTELLKLFEGTNSAKYIQKMKENGILYILFEFLEKEEQIPKNTHHHLNLIDHSIETIHQIEIQIPTLDKFAQNKLNSYQATGIKYMSLLKLSSLLHDVGKPLTWSIDETGRHRFINHDSVGAELLKPYLKEMKFSKSQIKYITTLVKNHIYPSQLAKEEKEAEDKAITRMFRKLGNYTIDVLLLAMADRLAAQGPAITKEITENNLNALTKYLKMYEKYEKNLKPIPKLIDGNEIAQILNIKKDKKLGEIIKKLKDAQIIGNIKNKKEAIEFIKRIKV